MTRFTVPPSVKRIWAFISGLSVAAWLWGVAAGAAATFSSLAASLPLGWAIAWGLVALVAVSAMFATIRESRGVGPLATSGSVAVSPDAPGTEGESGSATVSSQPETPPSPVAIKAADSPNARTFVGPGITLDYLFALFDGKTDVQAHKTADIFIGKWITVSGRVGSIGKTIGRLISQVTFERDDVPHPVYMMFRDESWVDRLSVLARGDPITVCGRIDRLTRIDIQLEDCELLAD